MSQYSIIHQQRKKKLLLLTSELYLHYTKQYLIKNNAVILSSQPSTFAAGREHYYLVYQVQDRKGRKIDAKAIDFEKGNKYRCV